MHHKIKWKKKKWYDNMTIPLFLYCACFFTTVLYNYYCCGIHDNKWNSFVEKDCRIKQNNKQCN